jgi:Zn finger protein HypA/HybF involved in hydrogenase expression
LLLAVAVEAIRPSAAEVVREVTRLGQVSLSPHKRMKSQLEPVAQQTPVEATLFLVQSHPLVAARVVRQMKVAL